MKDPQQTEAFAWKRLRRQWLALVLFSLVMLAALFVYDARHPQAWQVKLNDYLAAHRDVHVAAVLTARRPAAFRADMPFRPAETGGHVRVGSEGPGTVIPETRPSPWPPPDEIWCVLLAAGPRDSAPSRPPPGPGNVILIAHHADLYAAAWIVHETERDAEPARVVRALDAIGCDFSAVEQAPE